MLKIGPDVLGATVELTADSKFFSWLAAPRCSARWCKLSLCGLREKPPGPFFLLYKDSIRTWLAFPLSRGKTRKTMLSLQRLATLWWKISKRYDAFIRKCKISCFPQPTNTVLPPQGLSYAHWNLGKSTTTNAAHGGSLMWFAIFPHSRAQQASK